MNKRAIIYARISRADEGDDTALSRQIGACRKLADLRGWEVASEPYVDHSVSAYSGVERKAWQRVLKAVERGSVDVVIAWHIDRMTRSLLDLEQLILLADKHGVGIATVSGDIDLTTDTGRMVARILAAVARAEVERKAERQRLANEQRAQQGKPHAGGPAPFGFADDRVTHVPEEAEAIRKAAEDVLRGVSLNSIACDWRERFPTRGKFGASGLRMLLLSPRIAGLREYRGSVVGRAEWEPILSTDTQMALEVYLRGRKGGRYRGGRKPASLLSGIATCGVCGQTVNASSYRGSLVYTCRSGHFRSPRVETDEWVSGYLITLLSRPNLLREVTVQAGDDAGELRSQADALNARLNALTESWAIGSVTDGQFHAGTKRLRAELNTVEQRLADAAGASVLDGIRLGVPEVREQWESLSMERRRGLLALFARVELRPLGGKVSWDPQKHVDIRPAA